MEEKKHVKVNLSTCIIILIVLVLLLISGVYLCINKNTKTNNSQESIEEAQNEKIYIGIDDCFLGIYENGKWYSSQKFTSDYTINGNININYKDISTDEVASQEKYYKHTYGNSPVEMKDFLYDKNENPEYYNEIYYFRYKNEMMESNIISTSSSNVFNTEYRKIEETESFNKYVEDALKQYFIEEATVNINLVIEADIEKDGNNEYIIAASSPLNEIKSGTLESEKFVYSFVILVKEDKANVFMSAVHPADELSINIPTIVTDIKICDLNNDSAPEICINTMYWDHPEKYVFSYNDDSLNLVLYGDFTW